MAGLIDKMIVGAKKGMNSVSGSSKTIAKKAEINVELEGLERDREELIRNLGELIYNLQKSEEIYIEKSINIYNEIVTYDERIKVLKQKLERLDEIKREGQESLVSQNDNTYRENENLKRCSVCGALNEEDSNFCAGCGNKL